MAVSCLQQLEQEIDRGIEKGGKQVRRKQTTQCRRKREVIIEHDSLELAKIGRSQARHGVPTRRSLFENTSGNHASAPMRKSRGIRTLKPGVPHPGALPLVMSFKPGTPME